MITDGKTNWHYLAIENISGLLRRRTSNHHGDFYCLIAFIRTQRKKKLEKHETVCKDHDFCDIIMPEEDNKILGYNPGKRSI